MKCKVMINAPSTLIQSGLTTRHLELVHHIYTEPVYERLMGEHIFDFTMTLPLQPIASLENKKIKRQSSSHETLEIEAETYVKCKPSKIEAIAPT